MIWICSDFRRNWLNRWEELLIDEESRYFSKIWCMFQLKRSWIGRNWSEGCGQANRSVHQGDVFPEVEFSISAVHKKKYLKAQRSPMNSRRLFLSSRYLPPIYPAHPRLQTLQAQWPGPGCAPENHHFSSFYINMNSEIKPASLTQSIEEKVVSVDTPLRQKVGVDTLLGRVGEIWVLWVASDWGCIWSPHICTKHWISFLQSLVCRRYVPKARPLIAGWSVTGNVGTFMRGCTSS